MSIAEWSSRNLSENIKAEKVRKIEIGRTKIYETSVRSVPTFVNRVYSIDPVPARKSISLK